MLSFWGCQCPKVQGISRELPSVLLTVLFLAGNGKIQVAMKDTACEKFQHWQIRQDPLRHIDGSYSQGKPM